MIEPFLFRALLGGMCIAIISAPLGSLLVWNRMSYFGETVAHSTLLGIAFGLLLHVNLTMSVLFFSLIISLLLVFLERIKIVPFDAMLGLTHHGALVLGVLLMIFVRGGSIDLLGYLFGDIYSVTTVDLWIILICGTLLLIVIGIMWQPLLRTSLNEELAIAEGVPVKWVRTFLIITLGLAVSTCIKIVGILLAIAFLIVPVVAVRPFAKTPEHVVVVSCFVGIISVIVGLGISYNMDIPGGVAIVLCMVCIATLSLGFSSHI